MNSVYYIIIFIILALVILYGIYTIVVKTRRNKKEPDSYVTALESIIEDNKRYAIENLKKAVRQDSENVDAYIKLGNLLREQKLTQNAIRIHRDLTFRNNLTREQKIQIYQALFEDYKSAQDWSRVLETGKKLLALTKDMAVLEHILTALDKTKKWDEAIQLLQNYKRQSEGLKARHALYLVMKGLDESNGHDARLIFRDAIKIHSSCAAAYYYYGLSYYHEGRMEEALDYWKQLAMKIPEKSYLVFEMVEKTYYEMGQFPKVESFYKELMQKHPDSYYPVAAMAMLMGKKGNWHDAESLLKKYLSEENPNQRQAMITLFKIYTNSQKPEKAVEIARKLLNISDNVQQQPFVCSVCGTQTDEPEWYCQNCHSLNTFLS